MYNRYIPQPDGTYRRNRVPDSDNPPQRPVPPPHQESHSQEKPSAAREPHQESCSTEPQKQVSRNQERQNPPACPRSRQTNRRSSYEPSRHNQHSQKQSSCDQPDGSVGNFLKQLLPKDFDTSDLLIVLLLLMMGGDCAEDKNNALLTLALYLFM